MDSLVKIKWWQWIPIWSWRIVAAVDDADEVPTKLPRNGAIMVGSLDYPKWLAFDCPCRTGHRIMLTLQNSHTPHWSLMNTRKLDLWPSVDYCDNNKRCHYIVRKGHIVWCRD